ncbi:MAG: hypothetical protein HZA12_06110 [Nitrospirae bacterium]|nr:hypothetical protein [Nitrospirota bacterium]
MKNIVIRKTSKIFVVHLLLVCILLWPGRMALTQLSQPPPPPPVPGMPSILEDIRNTRHNLSSVPPPDTAIFEKLYGPGVQRRVFTVETTEVCIFCHTPHGASVETASQINAPLWNRSLSTARYILYDQVWSTSFEGYEIGPKPNAPTGYSRLCLSCHDGTIALGTIINAPGSGGYNNQGFLMTYAPSQSPAGGAFGRIPVGSGPSTGDTRLIGTNLQNDHPISFVFDSVLANRDEELVDPGPALVPPAKVSDSTPISPLRRYPGMDPYQFDSVQCTSCHNPHAAAYPKFLRAGYFNNDPNDPNYATGSSKLLCLYCHDKPGWVGSSHDTDTFKPPPSPTAANPYNYDGEHTVGQYACRACHDPHTVQGARRLLREGVDANNNFAIENTCFQCHKPSSELAGGSGPFPPDIRSEFQKDTNSTGNGTAMNLTLSQTHEPVFVARPQEGVELFSPAPPLFNEYLPGTALPDTAHVECVDCHNPHQVRKENRLKGMKGIDINGNIVGAKIPGNSREPYVFEVCFRCHGNSYTNLFVGDRFPEELVSEVIPGASLVTFSPRSDPRAGTPANGSQFSLKGYSNKRKEFDPNTPDTSPNHSQQPKNTAYHPVAAPGRNGSLQLCNQLAQAFNLKSSLANPGGNVGNCDSDPAGTLSNITIQCTDCHNNNAFENVVRGPITGLYDGSSYRRITDSPAAPNPSYNTQMQTLNDNPSKPQGPHGSDYIRILRARYNTDIFNPSRCFKNGTPNAGCAGSDGRSASFYDNFNLCFQCHDRRAFDGVLYNYPTTGLKDQPWTNFFGKPTNAIDFWEGNLHKFHLRYSGAYCHECHYNVHSNVEAQNTIYGDGSGGGLPPDSGYGMPGGVADTHLLNFAPTVTGSVAGKPRWFYNGNRISCYMSCHNVTMDSCSYQAASSVTECQVSRCGD